MLSIIITTYNRSHVIKRAIDSVLKQSYKNYELIIVDDGSEDNTRKIVEEYKDDRIKYYFKKNGGAASAKNYGAIKSKEPYIMFLDSDDTFYDENTLFKISKELGEIDFLCSSKIIKLYPEGEKKEQSRIVEDLYGHMLKSPLNYPGFPMYIFKKEIYFKAGGMDETLKWGEALGFWRRYFKFSKKNKTIDEYSYIYYLDTIGSVSKGINKKDNIKERIRTIEKAYRENLENLNIKNKTVWLILLLYFSYKILEKEKVKKYVKELKKSSFKEIILALIYIYTTKIKKK